MVWKFETPSFQLMGEPPLPFPRRFDVFFSFPFFVQCRADGIFFFFSLRVETMFLSPLSVGNVACSSLSGRAWEFFFFFCNQSFGCFPPATKILKISFPLCGTGPSAFRSPSPPTRDSKASQRVLFALTRGNAGSSRVRMGPILSFFFYFRIGACFPAPLMCNCRPIFPPSLKPLSKASLFPL